jgi:hypothetical protein
VSNILENQSVVTAGQSLGLGGGQYYLASTNVSTLAGSSLVSGVPYNVPFSVKNPNNYTVFGMLCMNFTMANSNISIANLDVYDANASQGVVKLYSAATSSLLFKIYPATNNNLFAISPGFTQNLTEVTVIYHVPGAYIDSAYITA